MTDLCLDIVDLSKRYPGGFQLGPISLQIHAGETVALLGKNGAGKSTLFQLLTGSLDATTGNITLLGERMLPEAFALKRRIGYLPQNMHLPRWVTGGEILNYAAQLYQLEHAKAAVKAAADYWDCAGYLHKPLAACSYGMGKRVALALANLHDPELLILDEPTSGLDLYHIRSLEDRVLARQRAGKATIISTHDTHNAARLADRALIIEAGQIRALPNWAAANIIDRIALIEHTFFASSSGRHE